MNPNDETADTNTLPTERELNTIEYRLKEICCDRNWGHGLTPNRTFHSLADSAKAIDSLQKHFHREGLLKWHTVDIDFVEMHKGSYGNVGLDFTVYLTIKRIH